MRGLWSTPYDPCVVNKDVNKSQMMGTWHINDLKVPHIEESEVKKFGEFLKANFENNGLKVTHHCGPVHDYLGLGLDCSEKGKFKVSVIPYLCHILDEF